MNNDHNASLNALPTTFTEKLSHLKSLNNEPYLLS